MVKSVLDSLESGSITAEDASNILFNIGMRLNDTNIIELAMSL